MVNGNSLAVLYQDLGEEVSGVRWKGLLRRGEGGRIISGEFRSPRCPLVESVGWFVSKPNTNIFNRLSQ
jgi:hypothetical protein